MSWLRPDGEAMAEEDWGNGNAKAIALLLSGEAGLQHLTERGEPEADDTFLLLLNASHEDVTFTLPAPAPIDAWQLLVNTAIDPGYGFEDRLRPRQHVRHDGAVPGVAGAQAARRTAEQELNLR